MTGQNFIRLLCLTLLMQACGSDSHDARRGQSSQAISQDATGTKIPVPVPNLPEAPLSDNDLAFFALLKSADTMQASKSNNIDLPGLNILDGLAKLMTLLDGKIDLDLGVLKDKLKELFPDFDQIGGLNGVNRTIVVYAITVMAADSDGQFQSQGNNVLPIMDIIAVVQIVTKIIEVFSDPNTSLSDLINLIKTGDINLIIDMIKDILSGVVTAAPGNQVNPLQTLPDFSKLLGIDGIKDLEELKNNFKDHVQYVLNNFDGPVKDALISLLKLGYGQAYRSF